MIKMEINANITITASYDDEITITVEDRTSSVRFLEMKLTREQFINAAMNRLGCTDVKHAEVRGLEKIGKKMEMQNFEFPLPADITYETKHVKTVETVKECCPKGWVPDLSFSSRESFFTKDGKEYARTTIRRWV